MLLILLILSLQSDVRGFIPLHCSRSKTKPQIWWATAQALGALEGCTDISTLRTPDPGTGSSATCLGSTLCWPERQLQLRKSHVVSGPHYLPQSKSSSSFPFPTPDEALFL